MQNKLLTFPEFALSPVVSPQPCGIIHLSLRRSFVRWTLSTAFGEGERVLEETAKRLQEHTKSWATRLRRSYRRMRQEKTNIRLKQKSLVSSVCPAHPPPLRPFWAWDRAASHTAALSLADVLQLTLIFGSHATTKRLELPGIRGILFPYATRHGPRFRFDPEGVITPRVTSSNALSSPQPPLTWIQRTWYLKQHNAITGFQNGETSGAFGSDVLKCPGRWLEKAKGKHKCLPWGFEAEGACIYSSVHFLWSWDRISSSLWSSSLTAGTRR